MPKEEGLPECIVATNLITEITIRVPAHPLPCTYVRVVGPDDLELVYWDYEEWQEDSELECMGAIMGVIKEVTTGHPFTLERQAALDRERAAWEDKRS